MTTNHRPTLESKRGKALAISDSIAHARSLPLQTALKYRQDVLTEVDPVRAKRGVEELKRELLILEGKIDENDLKRSKIRSGDDSSGENDESDESDDEEALLAELQKVKQQIADDNAGVSDKDRASEEEDMQSDSNASEDSNDESDDETELLLAELAKIKQERQQEKENKEKAERAEKAKSSNPLVSLDESEPPAKKSWRSSTAFNNKPKPKPKGEQNNDNFTNDTLRSEFHKKFLSKYIR
ncbi:uncharacterized protein CANTADRAFT_23111 [Suhomyces tanzawaensis NRRL Y-17324]|uniref:Pre-mRNA-splicing factor CWC15 n=1 Tax=Suhomyces tanzawaensis NRRL Y-17324 TaxID=984487 RepID=A0A1E4SEQ5_9ASCO|nr:uncharacterized protein CANTADRAFT_23111 [Suhomyces tanzawaensis NRRL Y-17324]ODV78001.1 hypothetical protein CANTADRAFT_23111 [Suhomyces tanzawaensis NRRL Y-17324]